MRTHYGPWEPCWISNRHQKHKSGRGPSSEHFWQVWLISVQRFQRRRFKCEKLTDGQTDAYPWQKLTWPMARWAKKKHYLKDKECAMIIDAPISSHNHRFMFTVFNANNISAISWWSILLEETRVLHGKNNSWRTSSHNVSSTPRHERCSNSQR